MLVTFGLFGAPEAVILLVVALVIFGPGKLPDVGKALGKGIKEFKTASEGGDQKEEVVQEDKKEK